jgi:hypothetical protein
LHGRLPAVCASTSHLRALKFSSRMPIAGLKAALHRLPTDSPRSAKDGGAGLLVVYKILIFIKNNSYCGL